MNEGDFRRGIASAYNYAKALELAGDFILPTSLTPSNVSREVTLRGDATYEEVYLSGLRMRDYNFQLFDYGYFQFSYESDRPDVRYAFYPNPFIGSDESIVRELASLLQQVEDEEIDYEEYLALAAEIRHPKHPPPIRYENAPGQYRAVRHPCSHFHFGHHDANRWTVRRVLTPAAFSLIVYKHFYSISWDRCGGVRINADVVPMDTLYRDARQNCRALGGDLFSDEEAVQFHFA